MDEAKAAKRKNGKRKKTGVADAAGAAGKAIDVAALLKGITEPGARLIVDMPVDGAGLFRLVLTEPGRRLTAWGSDMDEAMTQLAGKISG